MRSRVIRSTSKVLRIGALLIALALVLASCGKSGHGHAVFSGSPSTTVGGTVTYSRYESLKFGYTILIPSTLAPGAENGNSQTAIWRSADGESVLQVLSERRGATQPSSATQLSRCGIDLRFYRWQGHFVGRRAQRTTPASASPAMVATTPNMAPLAPLGR